MATEAAFAGDWFKTGDLGFFDDDGYLFLTGRIREIINRGGEKIAPQEVDEVLLEHPAVAEAVTFAVPHATLGEDVASAVVLRPDAAATPKDIRQFAIGRIADFKVPRQVLIVREIPKGPTGKVQRIGLAAKLGLASQRRRAAGLRRATDAAREGAGQASGQRSSKSNRSVFTMTSSRWAETLSWPPTFSPTSTKSRRSSSRSPAFSRRRPLRRWRSHLETLIEAGQAPRPSSAIVRVPRENGVAPASIAQERLWKLQQALPDLPFFNILYALRLTSPFDAAVLERSINEIVRRHEILRTTFAVVDGRHVQVIAPQLTVPLAFDDLHALPKSKKETVGHQLVQEELLHSFDLAHGPLVRARLVRLAEREHLLLIAMHQDHPATAGRSACSSTNSPLSTTPSAAGRASPLTPLPIQYADFAYWQRHWRSHPDIVAQLAYWREQLRDPLPVMKLATAPSETDNRRFPHGAAGGGVAGEACRRPPNASASEKAARCS